MSEKYMNNAAFSNIQKLFSEPVNTICFVMKRVQSNEINKYLKIYVEITVLYIIYYWNAFNPVIIIPKFIIIIHGKRVRRKMIPNSW